MKSRGLVIKILIYFLVEVCRNIVIVFKFCLVIGIYWKKLWNYIDIDRLNL